MTPPPPPLDRLQSSSNTLHMQCDRLKRYLGPVLLHFLKDAFTGRGVVGESSDMTLHNDEGDDNKDEDDDGDDGRGGWRAELSCPIPVHMSCHVISTLRHLLHILYAYSGSSGSFYYNMISEANAVARAHVAALGGNALLCYRYPGGSADAL